MALAAALALLAALPYWGIAANDFVNYDDQVYITQNPQLDLGLSPAGLKWAFTTNTASNWHPLTWISHLADVALFGRNPAPHHRVNVAFHALNSALVFLSLLKLTGRIGPSVAVAAFFAVHPLDVESVAWAAERKNLLSTLFWLLATLAYGDYAASAPAQGGALDFLKSWRYWLVAALLALGLMAKPMLVTLPFVLLLLDSWPLARAPWPLDRTPGAARQWTNLVIEKIPLLALVIISSLVTMQVQESAQSNLSAVSLGQRLANATVCYVVYLRHIFLPYDLAVLYPHPRGTLSFVAVAGSLAILAAITFAALRFARQAPYLPVGWFWYVGTLVPVIGIVQIGSHAMADRYTYVPMLGVLVALVWSIDALARPLPRRVAWLSAATGVCVVLLVLVTARQMRSWRDTGTLFARALAVTRDNDVAHFHVGNDLNQKGDLAGAIAHYRAAVRITPADEEFALTLANALGRDGKFDEALGILDQQQQRHPGDPWGRLQRGIVYLQQQKPAEAIIDLNAVLKSTADPQAQSQAYFNLGVAEAMQQHKPAALARFERALAIDPTHADAHFNAAMIERDLGHADRCVAHLREAIRLRPRFARARQELAITYARQKNLPAAVAELRQLLEIEPGNVGARYQLGQLLLEQGQTSDGVAQLAEAHRLKPDADAIANDLAWHLATTEQSPAESRRALDLALRVCARTKFENASHLDTLAAAYAAVGKFDDAVATSQKALAAARSTSNAPLAEQIERRARLYASRKPYRAGTS